MLLVNWKIMGVGGICSLNFRKELQTKACKHTQFGEKDCMTEQVNGLRHFISLGMLSLK